VVNGDGRAIPMAGEAVLEVEGLETHFLGRGGPIKAVDRVSFSLGRGETLGIVGESGCGKSVTALSILRLVPSPPGRIVAGRVLLDGQDLLALSESEMRAIRGKQVSMIFQEPMTSLNPVLTVGRQIVETLRRHERLSGREAQARALEMLELVRIPDAPRRLAQYPHELSGGMRQRVMIAIALACHPDVLLADEPTTALDVTIQAQILGLLQDLRARLGTAVVLITHDLGVVAEMADRVVVMYAGRKVEEAAVDRLFARPRHPYTRGLLTSVPRLTRRGRGGGGRRRLAEIPGLVPDPGELPRGCSFAPRCALATERCRREAPPLEVQAPGHLAACWEAARVPEMARA